MIQAIGIGAYMSYGVFFHPLNAEFGWSRATISGASSLAYLFMGLIGIIAGRLNDRIGPGKVLAITGFFFGLGCLLMSRLETIWQLYLFYGICVGIGLGAIDVIPLTTTARWFVKNRGLVTGIVKTGTGAGQFIVPFITSLIITSYGWRTSFVTLGIFLLISLIAVGRLLRRDPNQLCSNPENEANQADYHAEPEHDSLTLREAVHTRQLWIICLINLTATFCLLSIMVHIAPHARDLGASATRAAGVLAIIGGISMAGRFFSGVFLDLIGSKKTMAICFGLLIIGLLWLQVAGEVWMLYLFALIYGIGHGGFFTIISPIVAEYFGLRAHGVLFGIVAFSGTVGGSLGPILTGYVFDLTAGYNIAFWLFTLTNIAALALLISLKPFVRKN